MRPQARIILALGAIVLAGLVAYMLMPRQPKTPPAEPPKVNLPEPGAASLPTSIPTTAPELTDPFMGMPPATATTATTAAVPPSHGLAPHDPWDTAFGTDRGTPPAHGSGTTPRSYTVQSGDSLTTISQKVYGNTRQVDAIRKANPGVNPSRLRVGQVLKMPEAAAPAPSTPAVPERRGMTESPSAPSLGAARTYKVQAGDNLRKISMRFYGNINMWRKIYDLNRSVIGGDPDNLRVGMTLRLPEGATTR